ncbi:hypothetical protein D6783_01475 [Candidatus Woesearchaeota archaeon]|nr:MAG: hypothetical protein D6783_01475 [Candidatus Woesearchaeota archaeon]
MRSSRSGANRTPLTPNFKKRSDIPPAMQVKTIVLAAVVIIALGAGAILLRGVSSPTGSVTKGTQELDSFAKCLSDSGAKMYGAYWCPHCKEQKEMFGKSFELINYVECALPGGQGQSSLCQAAGIEGYPTWVFGNGERRAGRLSFETLADLSGCELP